MATSRDNLVTDDDDDSAVIHLNEEDQKNFEEECRKAKKEVNILCGGPTGSGKSTLLNSLMGIEEAEVQKDRPGHTSATFHVGESLDRGTTCVCQEEYTRNGITIRLWDTPGLEREDDIDEAYLEEIKKKCQDYDIFLYCVQGNVDKATELLGGKSSLVKFTKIFGPKLWENGVIAITQANRVVVDYKIKKKSDPSIDIDKLFQDRMDEWKKHIKTALINAEVKENEVNEIPILPVGWKKKSVILPGDLNWLRELHDQFIMRMKLRGMPAFIMANEDQYARDEMAHQEVLSKRFKGIAGLKLSISRFTISLIYTIFFKRKMIKDKKERF